jgi:Tfp pilus assembly protein PilV
MGRAADERGETLVEILLTLIVMAIGLTAIVGALTGSVIASDAHRGMATSEVIVRQYGEAIKTKAIQATSYGACPTTTDLAPQFTPPAGWTAQITQVELWVPDPANFPNGDWSAPDIATGCDRHFTTCGNPISACDAGLQRVTFTVTNSRTDYAKTAATARVVVRRGDAP